MQGFFDKKAQLIYTFFVLKNVVLFLKITVSLLLSGNITGNSMLDFPNRCLDEEREHGTMSCQS